MNVSQIVTWQGWLAASHITSKDHAWTTSSTTYTQEESLCMFTVWVWNLSLCSHSSWSNWINSCMSACVVTYTWIAFALTQAHPKMMQHPTSIIVGNSTTNKGSTKHPSQPRWVYNWLIIELFTCRTGVGCTKRSKINVFFFWNCVQTSPELWRQWMWDSHEGQRLASVIILC